MTEKPKEEQDLSSKIVVYLDEAECKVFRLLLEARAFEIRGGTATISFDGDGVPRYVEVTTRTRSAVRDNFDVDLQIAL